MINLCSSGHEEICHEGRECPVCALQVEHTREIGMYQNTISDQERQICELLSEIESHKEQVATLERQLAEPMIKAAHESNATTTH